MECKVLTLLVGSNPLPNYLAAATLRPQTVHLVDSPQTEQCQQRLRAAFQNTLGIKEVRVFRASSATKPHDVERACHKALEGADHLNYTGGTKVMAAQARMTFGVDRDAFASYVDEASGCIRFDNEIEIPIDASTLTIAVLLHLHGLEDVRHRTPVPGDPTQDDAETLAQRVLSSPEVAQHLYERFPDPSDKTIRSVKRDAIDVTDLDLSVPRIPEQPDADIKHWLKFLRGEWLEEWTARKLRQVDSSTEIRTGVRPDLRGREFECDVLLLRGARPFLVSCTTDVRPSLCKSKLFEAALRARQLGGDLARYALVSLMPDAGVSQVQRDVAAVWDAPIQPCVFGIEHLRQWAGAGRSEPSLALLREWLDR